MGAGIGAIPGEGFVGTVSACSHFGSEPALPLLPVRFLAHPAEKAQIGPNSLAVPDFTLLVVLTPPRSVPDQSPRDRDSSLSGVLLPPQCWFTASSGVCGGQGTAT